MTLWVPHCVYRVLTWVVTGQRSMATLILTSLNPGFCGHKVISVSIKMLLPRSSPTLRHSSQLQNSFLWNASCTPTSLSKQLNSALHPSLPNQKRKLELILRFTKPGNASRSLTESGRRKESPRLWIQHPSLSTSRPELTSNKSGDTDSIWKI